MMLRRASAAVLALTLAATGTTVGAAAAAAPTITRVPIDDEFVDESLSEECGVEVNGTAKGFVIIREFEQDGARLTSVLTINITVTLTAGDNTIRLKDVGADLQRTTPEGVPILQIVGQIPFGFTGVLKIDPETGEVLHEPRDTAEAQVAQACAALTA